MRTRLNRPRPSPAERDGESGSMIIEMAIALPLLFLLLFATVGTGFGLWWHHVVTNGVRDGIRFLARADLAREEEAINIAFTGDPADSTPYWFCSGTCTITVTGPDAEDIITMTATVPVDLAPLAIVGISPTITLTVTDQARWIGE